jgi:hypothetical protein
MPGEPPPPEPLDVGLVVVHGDDVAVGQLGQLQGRVD